MKTGTRVRMSTQHLRDTGQYTGPEAPTHVGPFARGKVTNPDRYPEMSTTIVEVEWEDGVTTNVHADNLEAMVR